MTNVMNIVDGSIQDTQEWIRDQILQAVDSGIERRKTYWSETDEEAPTLADARRIARSAAKTNALVAGATTLAPAPAGLLTIPAELFLTIRNTVEMVYDIAVAHGREADVTPALVVAIAFADAGGLLGLLREDEPARPVKLPQRKLLGKVVTLAGRHFTKRLLRAAFGRVVPVVGAAAVAWWTRKNTLQAAHRAERFFSDDQPLEAATPEEEAELEAQLDARLSEPSAEVELAPAVRKARHAFVANMLRAVPDPSQAQLQTFDSLFPGDEDNSLSVLARQDDLPVNLPVLASLDLDDLWDDVATVATVGNAPSESWREENAAIFGMSAEDVDEMLAYNN